MSENTFNVKKGVCAPKVSNLCAIYTTIQTNTAATASYIGICLVSIFCLFVYRRFLAEMSTIIVFLLRLVTFITTTAG